MVSECHTCGVDLCDQDIIDAGMEEICHQCWDERWFESKEEINSINTTKIETAKG